LYNAQILRSFKIIMNIVFFAHPTFLKLRSMDNFTKMLSKGMAERGHTIQVWNPTEIFFRLPVGTICKKWMGYIDAYLLFPIVVKYQLRKCKSNTLFVFSDQALGPWIPLVSQKPHVVHCHDFLALQSAEGEFQENKIGWTGRQYQKYILHGYQKARNFISVSTKTSKELERYVSNPTGISAVAYNSLNNVFTEIDSSLARRYIHQSTQICTTEGFILHVGGNQWYKNRPGVIEIYNAWKEISSSTLPLLLVGEEPSDDLIDAYELSPFRKDIYFLVEKDDEFIHNAYAGASVLLFPSIAEGFGWPIAEAMTCGCLVITTAVEPMTEVGGDAAFYIQPRPTNRELVGVWAAEAAKVVENVICLSDNKKSSTKAMGFENVKRFEANRSLSQIEQIYLTICSKV
jgi:glycosyltransferase involved in cell wall biosynthesis